MKAQSTGPILSAIFVDYDNVYLSLKRKNEEAARRFAKDAAIWLKEIETGALITATNGSAVPATRRIAMNRCYGNPVPRRNANDNSTDMNSFPFVRHHFLRAGFEAIDCPPLTSQLKNSADIKMVLDIGDLLSHNTYFDEFVILSGDADFTPVLHRLRAHARRTIVFATDHTAAPYTAISDGEIREADLVSLLLEGRLGAEGAAKPAVETRAAGVSSAQLEAMRKEIVAEVVGSVRAATRPVPLEALADRAVRVLGHDKTVASAWGGAGSFRDLLSKGLPNDIRLSDQPPYVVIDMARQIAPASAPAPEQLEARPEVRAPRSEEPALPPMRDMRLEAQRYDRPAPAAQQAAAPPTQSPAPRPPQRAFLPQPPQASAPPLPPSPSLPYPPQPPQQEAAARASAPPPAPQPRQADAAAIQQSIARIHEACQAPPLSPPEYRALFDVIAEEINTNNLAGVQTLINIGQRARDLGLELRRDDIRFVLEVISEADPWFEQGASAALFASRFRNFVVARCRSQGLNLSADEIDLIDAWFGGATPRATAPSAEARAAQAPPAQQPRPTRWGFDEPRPLASESEGPYTGQAEEEFPRIIRTRLRG